MHVYLSIALAAVSLWGCDSSSGSKSTPVAPVTAAPTSQPIVTGSDGVAGLGADDLPPSGSDISGGESTAIESKESLPFGLTTTRVDLLKRLGDDLSFKAKDFRISVDALKDATAQYCAAPSTDTLDIAQTRWREVMGIWQYFEVFQVGPLSENAKSLKTSIYGWPDPANYCKIEEESLKASKSVTYRLPPNNNRKGLQAVEFLLFNSATQSRCASGAVATEWNTLTDELRTAARCSYLKPLTNELASHGLDLESRWGRPGDNYLSRIVDDRTKVDLVIQSLYEAAFYIDLEFKNQKLAGPAGLDAKYCKSAPTPCLSTAEFAFSGYSREAMKVNVSAFIDMMFGSKNGGRLGGLSALVRNEGIQSQGGDVADRTEKAVVDWEASAQSDEASTLDQLVVKLAGEDCDASATSWVCRTRNGIRKIFIDFKGEYAAILKVQAPAAAAGDND
jgi:predicted lipoprotein